MLAITSYRRNGWIIDDAMTDLDNLYRIIASRYGTPQRTVVYAQKARGGGDQAANIPGSYRTIIRSIYCASMLVLIAG